MHETPLTIGDVVRIVLSGRGVDKPKLQTKDWRILEFVAEWLVTAAVVVGHRALSAVFAWQKISLILAVSLL